jgi:hypothetical protein
VPSNVKTRRRSNSVKIWSKRAAGVGAIIGGLLVAGSVAANAADLPLASSLPLVGNGQQQQAAPAVPANMAVPQVGNSKAARPKHAVTHQKAEVSRARPGYGDDTHGDDPSVVVGNGSGNKNIVSTGNTNVNAPVNVCGNPVNAPLGIAAAAQCDNEQNNVSAGSAGADGSDGPSVVVGDGSGLDTETLLGNTNTNTPTNTCGNPESNGGLLTGSQCRNRQNNVSVGHAS